MGLRQSTRLVSSHSDASHLDWQSLFSPYEMFGYSSTGIFSHPPALSLADYERSVSNEFGVTIARPNSVLCKVAAKFQISNGMFGRRLCTSWHSCAAGCSSKDYTFKENINDRAST